jgi:uncharacterized LabA/DUF88 family protein
METNTERLAIFIDGSNLYFKLRSLDLENLTKFNYRAFLDWLARERDIVFQVYYVGAVKAKPLDLDAQALRKGQQALFWQLLKQGIRVQKGFLMKNRGIYHEKGVDVHIAVDLLVGAYENIYDDALIISSDTDLLPAMAKVKALGKSVEYVGFGHQPSLAMQTAANLSRLILKEELISFIFDEKTTGPKA